MISVSYHKEDFNDADHTGHGGDFIDDDALMQRYPPGADIMMTSLPVRTAGDEQMTVRSKQEIS